MFENTLGARVVARASAHGANYRPLSLTDFAHILLAIFSIGAAILFFGWLMLLNPLRPASSGLGAESDCKIGRAHV